MTTACVVQARTGSTRLPGKVLRDVGGMPMLTFLLRRLSTLDVDHLVVATSSLPTDDPIAELAAAEGLLVARGDEGDVLARYMTALDAVPADTVVRITGDCPLSDPALIKDVIELHRATGADYASNIFPRTYPKGLDVEVASATALREAACDATSSLEREHVMPYLYRHPERFSMANLWNQQRLGEERWTVDTANDLEVVRNLVAALDDPVAASWQDILAIAPRAGPAPLALVPTSPDAALAAARTLDTPWGVELAVQRGQERAGTVLVGVASATATAALDVGNARDEVVAELTMSLRESVQVDRVRFTDDATELTLR